MGLADLSRGYMLINLGSGPELVILPSLETREPIAVAPTGTYAVRLPDAAPSFAGVWADDDQPMRGGVRAYNF